MAAGREADPPIAICAQSLLLLTSMLRQSEKSAGISGSIDRASMASVANTSMYSQMRPAEQLPRQGPAPQRRAVLYLRLHPAEQLRRQGPPPQRRAVLQFLQGVVILL